MGNETNSSRVLLSFIRKAFGIETVPDIKETEKVPGVIYRSDAPEGKDLGRFGDPDSSTGDGGSSSQKTTYPHGLSPAEGDRVKGNSYMKTPEHKPPRRKSNPKSYTHEKNREYQQKFKDLNGDRK